MNNIKNPVEQQSPEDEAEYIQNLYSYKQPDANADESDDIDRRTSLDNAFDSNIQEPTKREQKKISNNLILIDHLEVDGDFIESQAFAFLAIRSNLGLPISFPSTTGCKKPLTGGMIIESY